MADDKFELDWVDEDAKDLGIFYIFSRYWLPVIVGGIIIVFGFFAIKYLIDYLGINFSQIDSNIWQ